MEKVVLYNYLRDGSQWLVIPIFIIIIFILIVVIVKNYKNLLGFPVIFKIAIIIVGIGVIVGFGRMAFAQSEHLILGVKDTRISIQLDKVSYNLIKSDARGNPYYISFNDSNGNTVRSFNVFTEEEISVLNQYNEVIFEYGIIDQNTIYIYNIFSFQKTEDTEDR